MDAPEPTVAPAAEMQEPSLGGSQWDISAAAVAASAPAPGLTWLDIGCGTGWNLRKLRDGWEPAQLYGLDILDWLDEDLRGDVDLRVEPAETGLEDLPTVDRVLMVETIEHLEAPWTVLRLATRLVRPGGRIVVTTPNVASLRHRIDMAVRGGLTAFRPAHTPHLTPVLPHVAGRILGDEGCAVAVSYAAPDCLPGGRLTWPERVAARFPRALSLSVVIAGEQRDYRLLR